MLRVRQRSPQIAAGVIVIRIGAAELEEFCMHAITRLIEILGSFDHGPSSRLSASPYIERIYIVESFCIKCILIRLDVLTHFN